MKLARALKEKKRLQTRMGELARRIQKNASWDESLPSTEEGFDSALDDYAETQVELIELKNKIAVANQKVTKNLILLSELKARLEVYKSIQSGVVKTQGYGMDKTTYHSAWSDEKKQEVVDEMIEKINELQDTIDEQNATIEI